MGQYITILYADNYGQLAVIRIRENRKYKLIDHIAMVVKFEDRPEEIEQIPTVISERAMTVGKDLGSSTGGIRNPALLRSVETEI